MEKTRYKAYVQMWNIKSPFGPLYFRSVKAAKAFANLHLKDYMCIALTDLETESVYETLVYPDSDKHE